MATNEENDLIGYDPLAWMVGDTDINEETIDNECCDSDNKQEEQLLDDDVSITSDYSDDLMTNTEESAILEEDDSEIEEIELESDSILKEEVPDDCAAAVDEVFEVDDLEHEEDMGAVTQDYSEPEETDGAQIDLDATLTIQNVVKLHEKLKNSLAIHDEIEINASDVSSIDTSTLQLLVSLKKNAVKLQKKVTIIYPSPRFVESAKLLGLSDVLGVHDV